ncbi:MAG: tRNA (adenosine(37)-N6)-threonylcarbamoyltransferase complex transferase subunit TsaD [Candidatus Staskawiczbacteria bacterium]|nr:tRNA (adenosine(37)-N6)-threonylcarbamoyltransferase complex transferase subunit TsaD [Candidatus Staskawiczbacteria bacterium]
MRILAIETSCDDTGIAILEVTGTKNPSFKVLSNIIASQVELGEKYGGVYPIMAKRAHEENLPLTLETALSQAKISLKNIDLIAVTNGPGLEPCLWVGVNFAKNLSSSWNIPIVPVNHIESHILVNWLPTHENPKSENRNPKIEFPAIALVVSGGHTQIILVKKIGQYKILGETRDDAAGECFDKCAKILGLGYPGGPIISQLATKLVGCPTPHQLPRPMINTKDYDFSFSGLKTAVLYAWPTFAKSFGEAMQKNAQATMAAEIQQAIIDVLIKKTIKAIKDYKAKSLILGGGVSANQELRKQFKNKLEEELPHVELIVPKPALSTDNGLMVAVAGYFNKKNTVSWKKIQANGNLRISK